MGSWVAPTAYLLGAGWFFATAVILGVVLGHWADVSWGTDPVFTLVGIVLGLVVAAVGGFRMLREFLRISGSGPTE